MTLIDDIAALVCEHYVLEDDIPGIVAELRAASVDLDADPADLAAAITPVLRAANNDAHLSLRFRPDGAVGTADAAGWHTQQIANALATNGGFAEVRRIDAQTGLFAISPYTPPVDIAAPYVAAVFTLLAGVEHLVIDLRRGFGGVPETIALICSYLVDDHEPVHLQDIVSRHQVTHQYWTTPVAAAIPSRTRVSVLTSARTFSGCEELAYDLQCLGRARVYGETTAGGAHPVDMFALTPELGLAVPVAMSVNAVTGTNWEQVGVVPDVPCPADQALDVALATDAR